jgi:hypothetical protein
MRVEVFMTKAMKALKLKVKIERPNREQVSREEALKRVKAFSKRKEKLIAAIIQPLVLSCLTKSISCSPIRLFIGTKIGC